jgi:drug/metabolite transporter superfamily protein YnfA
MTTPQESSGWTRDPLVEVDLPRYWSTAIFTGLIAAFAALVILRFAGDVFDNPLFVTEQGGADELVPLTDGRVFWSAVVVNGTAAAVLNMMLYLVPKATRFFRALGTVVLIASLLWPLSLDVGDTETAWLIAIHIVVGATILLLLPASVGQVTRPYQSGDSPPGQSQRWA